MGSTSKLLVTDGNFASIYDSQSLPHSFSGIENGEKVVWGHDVYQEIGRGRFKSRFKELICRIKRVVNYVRCFGNDTSFSSPKKALNYLFLPLEPTYSTVYKRTQRTLKEIAEEYTQLKKEGSFPDLLIPHPVIREGLTLSMKGIELLADYLSRKSNLSNLKVCDSLQTFQAQLKQIIDDPSDSRFAFIVPSHQNCINPDPRATVELHMMSVLVEKIGGKLHICVLEPMAAKRMDLETVIRLSVEPTPLGIVRFDPDEQVMAFAREVSPLNSTTLYYTDPKARRQYGPNGGCSTFALRDAVNFIKKGFFHEIGEEPDRDNFRAVKVLPPAFMQPTQSIEQVNEYVQANPALAAQKMGKKQLPLLEAVKRRTYRKLELSSNKPRMFNMYIDERTAKYQELLLCCIKSGECTTLEKSKSSRS